MTEMLHLWALVPAAVGTCCAATVRRGAAPEFAASAFMLVAMSDIAITRFIAPLGWAASLLLCAMTLAWLRRTRRPDPPASAQPARHTALGLIVMALLVVPMIPPVSAPDRSAHHGMDASAFGALIVLISIGYACWSLWAAIRERARAIRVQHAAMGASVIAMAAAMALP